MAYSASTRPSLPAEGGQEPVAELVHRPDRGLRAGLQTVLPSPSGGPVENGPVTGDDRDRHVAADVASGDDRQGRVVAKECEHEIVAAVGLHVGDEGAQRVLDGLYVRGADPLRIGQQNV